MAEVTAERVWFDTWDDVVRKGGYRFESPPYIQQCMEDGVAAGEPWSVLVDLVEYNKLLFEAKGQSKEDVQKNVQALYLQALIDLGFDELEAEMFWETYLDTVWERDNPYAVEAEQPAGTTRRRVRRSDGSAGTINWEDDGVEGPVEEIDPDSPY